MTLTKREAEQIVKEALDQGWAEEANSERATEHGEGSVDMWENYGGGGWDRSQAAEHHDWGPAEEILSRQTSSWSPGTEVCRRCHTSRNGRTDDMKCPGVWVKPQPMGTYYVVLLFPGMFHSTERYWITTTDDWRRLKAKVDELKEIIKQAVERGWYSGSFQQAPKKSGKLGMYIEIALPGDYSPRRVGGMRTWNQLCREFDATITVYPDAPQIEA